MYIVLIALGILALVLIPFAPSLVRLRIRILRWFRWSWAANLLENHFDGWVLFFRVVLLVIAVMLFSTGWEDLIE